MSLAPLLAVLPPLAQAEADGGLAGLALGGGCGLIGLILVVLGFAAFVWALVDILKRDDLDSTMKLVWVVVVLFGQLLGVLIYYFVGRSPGGTGGSGPVDRL